jgi:hypothetical protein
MKKTKVQPEGFYLYPVNVSDQVTYYVDDKVNPPVKRKFDAIQEANEADNMDQQRDNKRFESAREERISDRNLNFISLDSNAAYSAMTTVPCEYNSDFYGFCFNSNFSIIQPSYEFDNFSYYQLNSDEHLLHD